MLAWLKNACPQILTTDYRISQPTKDENGRKVVENDGLLRVFNPRDGSQSNFATGRSLARVSNHMYSYDAWKQGNVGELVAVMAADIGELNARDLAAYMLTGAQLPTQDVVLANPEQAPVPTDPGANRILTEALVSWTEEDTVDKIMTYMRRLHPEWQAGYASLIMATPVAAKKELICGNSKFALWCADNAEIIP